MDLNEISIFSQVVKAGSFTGAAKQLGLPKSTVSAKVASLERRLGLSLLHRTTRQLRVTAEGDAFYRAAVKGLADLEAAEAAVVSGNQKPRGLLRVTAPLDVGTRFLPGFFVGFLERYPEIEIDLVLTGRVVDLIGEGIDVAIRASAMQDSTLVAKKVATSSFHVYGSPKYLARAGHPSHPRDLAEHRVVAHSRLFDGKWELAKGKTTVTAPVTATISVDELSAVKELVVAGLGLGLLPDFICAEGLRSGELAPVLPGWQASSHGVHLVYPAQRYKNPKVRAFVDEIAEALKEAVST